MQSVRGTCSSSPPNSGRFIANRPMICVFVLCTVQLTNFQPCISIRCGNARCSSRFAESRRPTSRRERGWIRFRCWFRLHEWAHHQPVLLCYEKSKDYRILRAVRRAGKMRSARTFSLSHKRKWASAATNMIIYTGLRLDKQHIYVDSETIASQ